MYWKADDADDADEEREEGKVLLLYVCLHSDRLVQENFPSSPSASSFHREEISCFMIRRIGLEFW